MPFQNDEITLKQAFGKAEVPLKHFMLAQTSKNSLETLVTLAG